MAQEERDPKAPSPGAALPALQVHIPAESIERPRVGGLEPTQPATAVQVNDGEALPLAVGSTIGQRYVIEKHISSGGFGAVYLAADREIRHHQVALKLMHRPAASEAERESALREL